MKALRTFNGPVANYEPTGCEIPEDLNLHQYCYENLTFRSEDVKTAISILCWSECMQLDTKVFIISSVFERPEAGKVHSQTHLLPCPVIMKCIRELGIVNTCW